MLNHDLSFKDIERKPRFEKLAVASIVARQPFRPRLALPRGSQRQLRWRGVLTGGGEALIVANSFPKTSGSFSSSCTCPILGRDEGIVQKK
jgi:hypothetical protein